jgi:hypothetical protein
MAKMAAAGGAKEAGNNLKWRRNLGVSAIWRENVAKYIKRHQRAAKMARK